MSFTVSSASNSGTTATVSVSISIPAGHTIGIAVLDANQSTAGTISDSAGNTYLLGSSVTDGTHYMAMYYCLNTASSVTSVSYSSTGTSNTRFVMAWNVSGTGTISKADAKSVFYNFNAPNTTDGATTGSLALTSSDGLILGYAASFFSSTLSAGTGFTNDGSFIANGSLFEHKAVSASAAATWTTPTSGDYMLVTGLALQISAAASAPLLPTDTNPSVQARWAGSDFIAPNLLADQILKPPPITQTDLLYKVQWKGVYTDFNPPNLLAEQILKPPPFTQENEGARTFWKGIYSDFAAPNLTASTLIPIAAPLLPQDLSQRVKFRFLGSDFAPANLLTGLLPLPPTVAVDATITIRAKGVFTDFSPPNLALSTLVPIKPLTAQDSFLRLEYRWLRGDDLPINLLPLKLQSVTPIAPQDLSGSRLDARTAGNDFAPPNLTLFLPVPPPSPPSTGAGRHGTRAQARRRRQLDVARARIEALKEQRAEADRALMALEDGEIRARAKLLKRIRVKPLTKPVEEYAPVKKVIAQRTVAMERHRSILEQIVAHQLEAERIQREIEAERDEEAALHLFHFLMMESSWYE